ncbi:hypothetical protein Slin15195_G070730 [Septoria linicola]|uniref:DUF1014-domain-containing protein n=1 Tax=Septoria linicola TaxID=215465 RepID=A0A9Q9ASC8_9PEZI|nr:hypothetical protein Slin14017_G103490 [Septoria linicola]USW53754.1 hypothetical protein Slin15195_G070730 [Septoria linicola]
MAKGENSKKVAGNAKKAEAAAAKQAVEDQKKAAAETKEWNKGAKDNSKAAAAADKQAEAARKKAEKDALLKEEEASLPSKPGKKAPPKKSKGLDLSGLDGPTSKKELAALNATGIDNALDALSLTTDNKDKIDRHPERRFKAAYTQFEERRLEEMKDEKGLRRQQKIDQIRKEFEKHPDNPFNQVAGSYNMSKEELNEIREKQKEAKENLLTGS